MNKELLKNKKVVIAGGIVVLILLFLGFILLNGNKGNKLSENPNAMPTQIPIPTITAEELGLTLEAGPAGKTVIVAITNKEGISGIEYELSYTSKGDIPRGAIGQLDITKSKVSKEITLGTCSDTCHYDEGVTNIKIVLKITKEDGNVYQAEKTLDSIDK
jgi:hypothetical protein